MHCIYMYLYALRIMHVKNNNNKENNYIGNKEDEDGEGDNANDKNDDYGDGDNYNDNDHYNSNLTF